MQLDPPARQRRGAQNAEPNNIADASASTATRRQEGRSMSIVTPSSSRTGQRADQTKAAPTLAEIKKWPATVPVSQAAVALHCSKSHLYALIRRGEAPFRTIQLGSRPVVITQSLVTLLESA